MISGAPRGKVEIFYISLGFLRKTWNHMVLQLPPPQRTVKNASPGAGQPARKKSEAGRWSPRPYALAECGL